MQALGGAAKNIAHPYEYGTEIVGERERERERQRDRETERERERERGRKEVQL